MFREQDMNAVVLLHNIDQPFVSALEAGDDDVKFQRIDADLTDAFKEEGDEEKLKEDTETLKELTLVLNANNDLVQYLLANKDGEHSDMFCKQLYDLAMISHQPLQADKMTEFINRSNEIMMLLTK